MAASFGIFVAICFVLFSGQILVKASSESHGSEPEVKTESKTETKNETAPVHWSYEDFDAWKKVNPVCTAGKRQSPINIVTKDAVGDFQLAIQKLLFDRYRSQYSGKFINNGHSIQFTIDASLPADKRPRVVGGGLAEKGFILEQFHFHWGNCSNCAGSEHLIDNKPAPAEVHFVHFNGKYSTFNDALNANIPDGISVITFLFEVVNDTKLVKTNYTQVTDLIAQIATQGNSSAAKFDIGQLIPQSALDGCELYYRYDGSLTTPPCLETVLFTVYEKRIAILESDLAKFRTATVTETDEKTGHSEQLRLVNNFRPVQALNSRVVKMNKLGAIPETVSAGGQERQLAGDTTTKKGAASSITFNLSVLLLGLLALAL